MNKTGPGTCRYYEQNGLCRYGLNCKFSHELSSYGGDERPPRPEETLEQLQAKADYNAWKRIIKIPPRPNDDRTIEQLWSGALTILNGDEREWKQMVPRDLDYEEYYGREHIKTILTMGQKSGSHDRFLRLVRPFLLVVTHSSFLDCLSVDTAVGGLYNFFGGTNGTRAVPFFRHLCEELVNAHTDLPSLATSATVDTTLLAASTSLRELLRREFRARFNDDLPNLIETMENTVHIIIEAQSQTAAIILSQMGEIRAMVARAKGLLRQEEEEHEALSNAEVKSTYPRTLQMPRDRHDNDKADITKISIFPTHEEIVSDETDFLPSTDLNLPHFLADQAERHIDTHFRLLRHDTFGELKDVLGSLMRAVENDPAHPRLNIRDFRVNQYNDACISYVYFDNRRGLAMNISFTPPNVVRKKSAFERRKWWGDSKRLAEGALLSFISVQDGRIQHLFFTVAERSTDTNKDHSLTKREDQGTITLKLASHDQTSVECAVQLSCRKTRGVLIEFPGILPATFTPILENLQDMQRHSRLPFRQWVLPDRISATHKAEEVDIPPPFYARRPDFSFSLEPILKPDTPHVGSTSINPTVSSTDPTIVDEMDHQTDLDRGQCQALHAALTREFAFIQGTPSTGKSYLGIQLMKVLMHCKRTVDLGPVVVV